MKPTIATILTTVFVLGLLTLVFSNANAQDTIQYTESYMVKDEVHTHVVKMYRGRIDELFENVSKADFDEAIAQRLVDIPRCAALNTSLAIGAPDEYVRRNYANVATHYENHHIFHIFALKRLGHADNSAEMIRVYFKSGFKSVYDNDITPLIARARAKEPEALAGLEDLTKRCNFYATDINNLNDAAQAKVNPNPETHYLLDDLEILLDEEEE